MENGRRNFIKTAAALPVVAPFLSSGAEKSAQEKSAATPIRKTEIPRWRGFNLLAKVGGDSRRRAFNERDFDIIRSWGFNFVRLPLSYWWWSSEDNWFSMNEKFLGEIDTAVEWGKQYELHVNLCFHRAPGYCVSADPKIKLRQNLFRDIPALEAFCFQWKKFAERYAGIPSSRLSFDLVNEPPDFADPLPYERVVRAAVSAIREKDAGRLIFADGYKWGRKPVAALSDMENFVQSGRGYEPFPFTHAGAEWISYLHSDPEKATWPASYDGKFWNKKTLDEYYGENWDAWEKSGGAVHIGEFGCYRKVSAEKYHAWLRDIVEIFGKRKWGYALWELRGSFGVLNTARKNLKTEKFRGFELDREALEILKNG